MRRIRENMALVVGVVAFSLLVFILTDFFNGSNRMSSGTGGSIGSIAGEDVDRSEFDRLYNQRVEIANQQGSSLSEMDRYQMQDGVWQQLVADKLYGKQYESLGLGIGAQELQDMLTGKNISPVVKQYFDNFFKSQNKPFNTEDVNRYLNAAINDPNEKQNLKQFLDYMEKERIKEKFNNMVAAGYVGSAAAAKRKHIEQNRKFDIAFVGVPFSQISDSTIKVDDKELIAYMGKYPNRFKQEENTLLKFVKFDLKPTKEDTLKAKADVEKWKEKFQDTANDSAYVANRSRKKFDPKGYLPLKDLPAAVKDSAKTVALKRVFGPVLDGDAYKLFKVIDRKQGGAVNAKVKQIVILPKAPTAADSTAALAEATAIKATLNAGNFSQVAMEKSQDRSKMSGGDMGWVSTPSQYGTEFDNAVQAAAKGSIVGPIKGNQGYHILLIEDKTDETFLVAEVEKQIVVSSATAQMLSKQANDFAQKAIAAKNLEEAAKTAGLNGQTSQPLKNNDKFLMGMPARELILWAISAKEGDFSKIYTMGDSYVLAQVSKKRKEGLQDLDEVKGVVMKEVLAEKKGKMILEKLEKLQGKSMEEIKNAYGAGAFASTATDINFDAGNVPAFGQDPYIVGKICGMAKGATSKPIVGKNGVYIVQVTDIKEPAPLDAAAAEAAKKSAASAGQSGLKYKIEQALNKSADIKDERWKAGI